MANYVHSLNTIFICQVGAWVNATEIYYCGAGQVPMIVVPAIRIALNKIGKALERPVGSA